MRALAAMLTGIAPLRVFLVLALSGTSTATTNDATVVKDLDHEVAYVPPAAELVAAPANLLAAGARSTLVSADCAAKRDVAGSDVVLLMGQSNMSGRGQGYDRAIDGPNNPRIMQWSRVNTIITAEEHLQHHDSSDPSHDKDVGPGTAFGRAYVETLPEQRNVLLVPTAHGGTALVNGPWSPGGYLFEDAMTRMEAALASDEAGGNCVAAVLWHQGESDAGRYVDEDAYRSAWADMIDALRSRIPAAAEAPVILGELAEPLTEIDREMVGPILEAIRAIPESVEFSAVAVAENLSVNPGQVVHFDAMGQREFGQRYFDKLGDAIGNDRGREARLEGVTLATVP